MNLEEKLEEIKGTNNIVVANVDGETIVYYYNEKEDQILGTFLYNEEKSYNQEIIDFVASRIISSENGIYVSTVDMTYEEWNAFNKTVDERVDSFGEDSNSDELNSEMEEKETEALEFIERFVENEVSEPIVNVFYKDGSHIMKSLLDENGEIYSDIYETIEQLLTTEKINLEEAQEQGFITLSPSMQSYFDKIVESYHQEEEKMPPKIILYSFNQVYYDETRRMTQACVFNEDGSVKNIQVANGAYRYDDEILDAIYEVTGERLSLEEAIVKGVVVPADENEVKNDFSYRTFVGVKESEIVDSLHHNLPNSLSKKSRLLHNFVLGASTIGKAIASPFCKLGQLCKSGYQKAAQAISNKFGKKETSKEHTGIGKKIKDFARSILGRIKKEPVIGFGLAALAVTLPFAISDVHKSYKSTRTSKTGVMKEVENQNVDYSNKSVDEMIQVIPFEKAKKIQGNNWNYINRYNDYLANAYLEEGKTSRLAITYDEVSAEQVGYNIDTLSRADMVELFGHYSITNLNFKENLTAGHYEDMLAYVVSREPIDKSYLFETAEGREFNQKYASMIASIVNAKSEEEKLTGISTFRQSILDEMNTMDSEMKANGVVTSFKTSLTPIYEAAEFICERDALDSILEEKDRIHLTEMIDTTTSKNFDAVASNLYFDQQAQVAAEMTDNSGYNALKLQVEKELTDRGVYNISDRDISDHQEFSKEELQAEETITPAVDNYIFRTDYTFSSASFTPGFMPTSNSNEKYPEAPAEPTTTWKDSDIDTSEDDMAREQAEADASAKQEEMQAKEDEEKEQLTSEVTETEEEYQENLDNANTGEGTITEGDLGFGTELDDENKDVDGNLANSVTDLTTDGTNSPEGKLPDANAIENDYDFAEEGSYNIQEAEVPAEEYADQMVEQMASGDAQVESGDSFVKSLTK